MKHVDGATLYVRTPAPMATEKRRETILGRLEALRVAGAIDDVTVTYWFRQASATDGDPVMPSVVALEAWADDHDVSLEPAFEHHARSNWFTGTNDDVVSLPVICLALLAGGDICAVYPHVGPTGYQSVMDGIDTLEAETSAERYSSA